MVQLAFISVCITLLAAFASAIPMERRIDQTIADSTACKYLCIYADQGRFDGGAQCNTMTIPQNGALTNFVSSPGTPFMWVFSMSLTCNIRKNLVRKFAKYLLRPKKI
ncbi:hypothetical protein BJV74DRAFT_799577 [Russula compacta]|nr:hypothetical protein BJV74DRAFT_799577 [Russula compacta]